MHLVKQNLLLKYRFFAPLIVVLILLSACNDTSDLGMDLLPTTDLIDVRNLVEKDNITAYTYSEGPIGTDEPSRSLIGSLYDPVFGVTTINLATQFRLLDRPNYGDNPVADSVRLILYYSNVYGDTITPQTFRVYEMDSPLDVDASYTQDIDLRAMASDIPLGEFTHTPVIQLDSASRDTFFQPIAIPIDVSLGQKLLDATEADMESNDSFLDYFKGLVVETESQPAPGGSILTLEAVYTSEWRGSALLVYYKNDAVRDADTTLLEPFAISPFSARVNSIEHDYTETAFEANLDMDSGEDSLIYVQSTGGLKSRILIEGLSSWADSVNISINKAEVVFQVDTLASEVDKFAPPSQLLFTYVNEDGEEDLPADFWFTQSPTSFYGGNLRSDYTYRFNITQHMQQILDGRIENRGFYLTTAHKNSEARRVVLKGSNSVTGIKLIITYSKFLQ